MWTVSDRVCLSASLVRVGGEAACHTFPRQYCHFHGFNIGHNLEDVVVLDVGSTFRAVWHAASRTPDSEVFLTAHGIVAIGLFDAVQPLFCECFCNPSEGPNFEPDTTVLR